MSLYDDLLNLKSKLQDYENAKRELESLPEPWTMKPLPVSFGLLGVRGDLEDLERFRTLKTLERFYYEHRATRNLTDDETYSKCAEKVDLLTQRKKLSFEQERADCLEQIEKKKEERESPAAWLEEAVEDSILEKESKSIYIEAGTVFKMLGIGLLLVILVSLLDMIGGFFSPELRLPRIIWNVLYLLAFFAPLVFYIREEWNWTKSFKKDAVRLKEEGIYCSPALIAHDIDQAAFERRQKTVRKLDEAIQEQQTKLNDLERAYAENQQKIADIDKRLEQLSTEQNSTFVKPLLTKTALEEARAEMENARTAFFQSLLDEFQAAKAADAEEYYAKRNELKEEVAKCASALSKASRLGGKRQSYPAQDYDKLDLVIEKIGSHRASTLSEALNAVDSDIRMERMHSERMQLDREYNERMEAQRLFETEERLELEWDRITQERKLKQQELDLAAEIAERDAAHQKELEEAARASAEAEKMRAAAEQERLENERRAQEEEISNNLNRCRLCVHAPNSINDSTYCYYGGFYCRQSEQCDKYRNG